MPDAAPDEMTVAGPADLARAPQRAPRQSVLAATALVVVLVDQLTKWWATTSLDPPIEVVWTLQFRLTYNTGAAFSLGRSLGPFIGILAVVVVVILVRMGRAMVSKKGIVALGLVAGGAVGNLIDRVFRAESGPLSGAVIDFIDFGWWPVFNVADMAIVVGAALMLASGFGQSTESGPEASTLDSTESPSP